MNRAVFLDRDGTIIEDKDYLKDPSQVEILPGAREALRRLRDAGFKLFIVSNQSGVGRGYFSMEDVGRVNRRLIDDLNGHGVAFAGIYIATESPEQPGQGRKPSPRFLFDARDAFGVDLAESYMIGDKLIDLECGWNAGVKRSILVRTGYGREWEGKAGEQLERATIADDLREAVDWILAQGG